MRFLLFYFSKNCRSSLLLTLNWPKNVNVDWLVVIKTNPREVNDRHTLKVAYQVPK